MKKLLISGKESGIINLYIYKYVCKGVYAMQTKKKTEVVNKATYISPLIQIIDQTRDIITESADDPNQGEWDVE